MGTSVFFNSKRWHSLVLRSLNPKPCCSWALCSLTPFAFGYFDPLKVGLWRSPSPLCGKRTKSIGRLQLKWSNRLGLGPRVSYDYSQYSDSRRCCSRGCFPADTTVALIVVYIRPLTVKTASSFPILARCPLNLTGHFIVLWEPSTSGPQAGMALTLGSPLTLKSLHQALSWETPVCHSMVDEMAV